MKKRTQKTIAAMLVVLVGLVAFAPLAGAFTNHNHYTTIYDPYLPGDVDAVFSFTYTLTRNASGQILSVSLFGASVSPLEGAMDQSEITTIAGASPYGTSQIYVWADVYHAFTNQYLGHIDVFLTV